MKEPRKTPKQNPMYPFCTSRIVGSYETLPPANQQEIQRILNAEAQRIYSQSEQAKQSSGAKP